MELLTFHRYSQIITYFGSFLTLCLLLFPYIKAEILSSLYLHEFDVSSICQTTKKQDFKFARLVEYEKFKGLAKVQCIFFDGNNNIEVEMNYTQGWAIIVTRNLNSHNSLYWPIYV